MNTITKTLAGTSIAFIALFSLAFTFSVAKAADLGSDYGWVDTGSYDTWSGGSDSWSDYGWVDTGYQDTWAPSQDTWNDYGWVDTGYQDTWAPSYDSSSYGSGFSMPSFGGSSGYGGGYSYGGSSYYPSYTPPKSSYSYTDIDTCVNNSCNTYTDNSVKISNSFNNQKKQKEQINDCYDYGYSQGYGYNGYADGYGQDGYNYGSYNYDGHCYSYAAPIAYNTTPYISLSQTPYTGLDLGPMGEVLYWTFLVLWCALAAYLIVVKRVQNKLVSFLNSFLFGGAAAKTAVHTTHASAPVSATLVEEGIDPFIQSQIKRS